MKKKVFAVVEVHAKYYEAESEERALEMYWQGHNYIRKLIDPPKVYQVPAVPDSTDRVQE